MNRPIASLSLDLDNQWAYLRAAARPQWADSASYFPRVIPRIVTLLKRLDLPLTVFLVGRDLECDASVAAIHGFADLAAWECANHSFHHEPWLHTRQRKEIEDEIDRTSSLIQQHFAQTPVGFRGPGFSCPQSVLSILAKRNYLYDASVFPTSMAPLARAYYMMKTGLRGAERERARQLYGGWKAMRQPNQPFLRHVDGSQLWEVPVTVMPLTRTPIHFSYLTYLASFSTLAAKTYFRSVLRLCQLTATAPSLLLHPPDFMGREDDCEMSFFPAMQMPREKKLELVYWALKRLGERYDVRTMRSQVAALRRSAQQPGDAEAVATAQAASTIMAKGKS